MTEAGGGAFDADVVAALRDEVEVEIETWNAARGARRVIIWSVVVDGVPYVRSYKGVNGRWYQDLLAESRGAVHVLGRRVPVRAVAALEPAIVQAISDELAAKYPDDSSMPDMLLPAVLGTTLRLVPD